MLDYPITINIKIIYYATNTRKQYSSKILSHHSTMHQQSIFANKGLTMILVRLNDTYINIEKADEFYIKRKGETFTFTVFNNGVCKHIDFMTIKVMDDNQDVFYLDISSAITKETDALRTYVAGRKNPIVASIAYDVIDLL